MTVAAVFVSGCGVSVSQKHAVPAAQVRPELEATKDQLIARYDEQARAIQTLNATVDLLPTTGSAYSGVIEEYHDVDGFILAKRPASIRVIGQAPVVGKNIFDMVSDGEAFRIYIPSKGKFIVGSASLERRAQKPIENLRPQHLLDALLWSEIPADAPTLFEEWADVNGRDYILTVLRKAGDAWEVARRIWFDRVDLSCIRTQIYGPGGSLLSDAGYSDWQSAADTRYPRYISIARWHDGYQLGIRISKLAVNEPITDDRFRLEQPAGTELVRAGEGAEEPKP